MLKGQTNDRYKEVPVCRAPHMRYRARAVPGHRDLGVPVSSMHPRAVGGREILSGPLDMEAGCSEPGARYKEVMEQTEGRVKMSEMRDEIRLGSKIAVPIAFVMVVFLMSWVLYECNIADPIAVVLGSIVSVPMIVLISLAITGIWATLTGVYQLSMISKYNCSERAFIEQINDSAMKELKFK